jgi:nucleoside-diphosphate-sugar epimerase
LKAKTKFSVAIIGGSGFVGSSIAKRLSKSFNVTVLDVTPPKTTEGTEFKKCDIRDKNELINVLQGVDLVVNTAIIQVPNINLNKRLGYEVNVIGLQNICDAVESSESIKGLLHTSSWHVFGEKDIRGTLNEEFGYRPDKIDERARLYALCKITQETIVKVVDYDSDKFYGLIRLGTVLGEGMPEQTAANIFLENSLKGEPLTPFKHTQHRPMLYVDIHDLCTAFESFAEILLINGMRKKQFDLKTVNLMSPSPITILELAKMVQRLVTKETNGRLKPKIIVVDKGIKPIFSLKDKHLFRVDNSRALKLIGSKSMINPEQSIHQMIINRLKESKQHQ